MKKKKPKDITGHAQHKHTLIIIPIMYMRILNNVL